MKTTEVRPTLAELSDQFADAMRRNNRKEMRQLREQIAKVKRSVELDCAAATPIAGVYQAKPGKKK